MVLLFILGKGIANDEIKFKSSWHLITHEEAKKSEEIIKNHRATAYVIEVLVMLDYSVYAWLVILT